MLSVRRAKARLVRRSAAKADAPCPPQYCAAAGTLYARCLSQDQITASTAGAVHHVGPEIQIKRHRHGCGEREHQARIQNASFEFRVR